MPRPFHSSRLARVGAVSRRLARPIALIAQDTAHSGARVLLAGVAAGLSVAAVTTLLARYWWVFDLTTHFRVHYVAIGLFGVLLALMLRRRAIAVAVIVLTAPHTVALSSLISPGTAQAAAPAASPVRVTTLNAYWDNWDGAALTAYVEQADPDILVIQEAGRRWRSDLLRIGARFPYAMPGDWDKARDVVMFSRFPMVDSGRRLANGHGFDYRTADLEIAGRTVTLVGVHTPSPGRAETSDMRNRYLAEIGRFAAAADHPVIVAGDFNSTAWSPHFADMIAASGLDDTANGRGWHPTWPTWLPAAGIQIDHILVSKAFEVRSFVRGPEIGSDHFPLTVDLSLRIPVGTSE